MGNSIHTSGLFFASGHSSKRVTVPDITLDSASSLNGISSSHDVPPLPLLNHLQPSMQEASRNSYMSVMSNISEFAAGFSSPVVKQFDDTCFSPLASSVCLPEAHQQTGDNKLRVSQGYMPSADKETKNQRAHQLLFRNIVNPLKILYGFSLKLFSKAFKPIHQALLDGVQAVQTYKKYGAVQVAKLVSKNDSAGKSNNLNFSCRGFESVPPKGNTKPFEFKLLELNMSTSDFSGLFKSDMPILL